ncbi:conserved hypothetical protein, partial [Ricinus communis]
VNHLVEVDDGQARGVEDQLDGGPCAPVGLRDRRGHGRELRFEFADRHVVAGLADPRVETAEFAPLGRQPAAHDLVVAGIEDLAQLRRREGRQQHLGRGAQEQRPRPAAPVGQRRRRTAHLAMGVEHLHAEDARAHAVEAGGGHQFAHHRDAFAQHRVGIADVVVQQDDPRPERVVRILHALQQPGLEQQPHIAVAGGQRDLERRGDVVRRARQVGVVEQVEHPQHAPQAGHGFFRHANSSRVSWRDGEVLRDAIQIVPRARDADDISVGAQYHRPRLVGLEPVAQRRVGPVDDDSIGAAPAFGGGGRGGRERVGAADHRAAPAQQLVEQAAVCQPRLGKGPPGERARVGIEGALAQQLRRQLEDLG